MIYSSYKVSLTLKANGLLSDASADLGRGLQARY